MTGVQTCALPICQARGHARDADASGNRNREETWTRYRPGFKGTRIVQEDEPGIPAQLMTAAGITGSAWAVSARRGWRQAPGLAYFGGGFVSVGGGVAFGLLLPGGGVVSAGGMVVVVPGDVD